MNTSFSSPGFELNSNIYTPDWSNHYDLSWQAHATENYTPQFHELHHSEYSQFSNPSPIPSSYDYLTQHSLLEDSLKKFMQLTGQSISPVPQESSLEDTLSEFRQTINQPIKEITYATMANTEAIARFEG
jgi:hypothetical protein